jgi:hypothetical protein
MLTFHEPRCSDDDGMITPDDEGVDIDEIAPEDRPVHSELDQSPRDSWWRRRFRARGASDAPRVSGRWGASDSSTMLGRYR